MSACPVAPETVLVADAHFAPTAPTEAVRCAQLFWLWVVVRTAVWTLMARLTQPNAPLDLVEWLSWGGQWGWGYPKHPPLPAWVADVFARLSPGDVWGVYLAGYLAAAVCLWAAWQLGREFLPPRVALLAALALDGLFYHTNDPAEFSNNVLLNAGWSIVVVCAYRALHTRADAGCVSGSLPLARCSLSCSLPPGRGGLGWGVGAPPPHPNPPPPGGREPERKVALRWWIALGGAIGLTLLCKYTLVVLLVPLVLYAAIAPGARRCWRRPGVYLAAAIALSIFAPHIIWMARHDWITLRYAAERSADARGWSHHLINPTVFLLVQIGLLLPVLFILWPLLRQRGGRRPAGFGFLTAAFLGPVVLLLLLSLTTGCQLRDIWGSPLGTFTGVWLLVACRSVPSRAELRSAGRRWAAVAAALLLVVVLKNTAWPYVHGQATRTHFPGKPLADEVERRWAAHCTRPLPIVAGEPWRAGCICCYSRHRPKLYSSGAMDYLVMDEAAVPWCSDAELNARGGAIVWDADQLGDELPPIIRQRFPAAQSQLAVVLPYQIGSGVPLTRVGLAFVWPRE